MGNVAVRRPKIYLRKDSSLRRVEQHLLAERYNLSINTVQRAFSDKPVGEAFIASVLYESDLVFEEQFKMRYPGAGEDGTKLKVQTKQPRTADLPTGIAAAIALGYTFEQGPESIPGSAQYDAFEPDRIVVKNADGLPVLGFEVNPKFPEDPIGTICIDYPDKIARKDPYALSILTAIGYDKDNLPNGDHLYPRRDLNTNNS